MAVIIKKSDIFRVQVTLCNLKSEYFTWKPLERV